MIIIDRVSEFEIRWEYNHFHSRNLSAVKEIPGRRYNPEKKIWTAPASSKTQVLALQQTHCAKLILPEHLKPEEIGILPAMAELTSDIALKPDVILRPYQKQ